MSPSSRRPRGLPAEATTFVGRHRELTEIRTKLAAARMVSLVGPGGVGKTRLAIRAATELARRFSGGAWLVELAELHDPALVGNAVMAGLDLRDQAGADPPDRLRAYLRDRELLLVLDNCEHLLEATAALAAEVLRAAPGVRVIATSREPLAVDGEYVVPVPPLELPSRDAGYPLARLTQNESVALFVERAAAASGGFELNAGNRASVVELCRRLDGLPLAIELAAVRTRVLSPEQIRDRLGDRFGLLTGGSRAALPRHQTLLTAVEWSYDLLAPAERTLATRLGVFAGRFRLEDVEAVCCFDEVPATAALDLLSSLVDKSLVLKEDAAGAAGYRLHETMREYARLELRAAHEEETVERACAVHYLSQGWRFAVEGRHRLLWWLEWMELEIDNVRAVLRRSREREEYALGIDLATALLWYWVTRATTEGVRWLDELLAHDTEPAAHPWAYFTRGFLAVLQADAAAARSALERGVTAARTAGGPDVLSQMLAMASIAARMAGDRASASRLLDEARTVARALDDLGSTLLVHQAEALNGLRDGDLDLVRSATGEGARLSREAGDLYSLGMMLMNQGFAALAARDFQEAEQRLAEGLRTARLLDDRVAQCYLIGALGCCAVASREPRLAAQLLGAMEHLRAELGASIHPALASVLAEGTAAASAALGPARFRADFGVGEQMGREAAARLALREPTPPDATTAEPVSSGPLGRRETEVARLVAEGLSNKEIGARLFISERTVESHVRSILNKLGFNSRAQIAGWMVAAER